jgi:hypothetical protein
MMQFARAAESGLSLGDSKGLAAAYSMLQDVIHEDDWGRFQENMINEKVDDEAHPGRGGRDPGRRHEEERQGQWQGSGDRGNR